MGVVPVTEEFSAGRVRAGSHTRRSTRRWQRGACRSWSAAPGLYLRAALCELDLRPPPPPGLRERVAAELEREGPEALHARLARHAPAAAAAIAPADRSRVVRALELLEMGEEPAPAGEDSRLWTAATRHPTLLCGLTMERDALYGRIDARVDAMVAAGAADEVRRAEAAGASPTARAALGFEELLAGDVDAMKRRTRNYAKRQLTWMRKLPDAAHRGCDRAQRGRGRRRAQPSSPTAADRVPRRALREVAGARQRLRDRRGARASVRADARSESGASAPPTPGSAPTACCCCPRPTSAASWPTCASSTRTAPRPSCRATACARR